VFPIIFLTPLIGVRNER